MIRPSSLPCLAACPCFVSGPGNDETTAGTLRHEVFAAMLNGLPPYVELPEDQKAGVEWAVEQVRLHAPMNDHPLVIEQRREIVGPDFQPIAGTPDVTCGPVLFDLKWRRFDYRAQMAAYALMLHDAGWYSVTCHVLYAESKTLETMVFQGDEAENIVGSIIESTKGNPQPRPCSKCDWCASKLTCPAVIERVNAVVEGRDDWKCGQYHPSDSTDPKELGAMLRIARLLAGWCESVEHYAKELAVKEGKVPAGFSLKSRQGNRYITSVAEAFPRCGIPQAEFLAACEVKLSSLAEAYAKFSGMKKAPAERELEAKLGEVIQRKPQVISLVADKE